MPTDQILQLLISERDRLTRAIEVLQGPIKRRGRPPKTASVALAVAPATPNGRHGGMTPAARRAQSKRMKAYWAKKRKEGAGNSK